jgi:tRNA A37 threonylcarbamoyladenosine biosynthesis protein TsaE
MTDKIVEKVVKLFRKRSKRGIEKYGVTLEQNDLSNVEWLQHLQEELMDAALYVERLKQSIDESREINSRD